MKSWAMVGAGALFVGGGGLFVVSHVQFVGVLLRALAEVW
jgi:hypothetical protein